MSAILTVDDSPSVHMAIRATLAGAGHSVAEAADGADGLSKARAERYDLIITDLDMPGMNGLEMVREIRKLPIQAGTPILFLTSETEETLRQQARAEGAADWLVKPMIGETLLRAAGRALGR